MNHQSIREAYLAMHEPEGLRRIAGVYWAALVLLGTLLMLGSVGYGMWQFFVPPHREQSEAMVGMRGEGFDKVELKKAVEALQARQDEFELLLRR